jgi:cell division GTPase FtsZ
MASTVKKSLAKSKNKESNMANDDFYKEAQRQHLRELLEAQQNENNQQEEEQQAAPPSEEAPVPAAQPVETPVTTQPPPVQIESVQQAPAPSLNYQSQNVAPTVEDDDDFDFVSDYDESVSTGVNNLLPENTAKSSLSVGFVGIGGGGGKMAKAFLDCGFNKTLIVNTTPKDQPEGLDQKHFLLLPGADGVGKDVNLGKQVLKDNGAFVEDRLRTRFGQVDWLFVLAGGGGGTGSACAALDGCFNRYLKSVQASGKVVYVVTSPTAQELLNPTIKANYESTRADVQHAPHVIIDNERQLQLLRGRIGMLGMYPTANKSFAKLLSQVLRLSSEHSPVQTFDSKDLERCLSTPGRIFLGTSVIKDPKDPNLGAQIYQNCLQKSPCPLPRGSIQTGVLLLVVTSAMASDPQISNHMEAAISYVGGRANALFSGVYVREKIPGLVAISVLGGL